MVCVYLSIYLSISISISISIYICNIIGFPWWLSDKESACNAGATRDSGFNLWVRKTPWRRAWQPTPVFLPGESHGQKSLAGYVHGFTKKWTRLK